MKYLTATGLLVMAGGILAGQYQLTAIAGCVLAALRFKRHLKRARGG